MVCKGVGMEAVYAGFDGVANTTLYVCGVDAKYFGRGRERASGYMPGKNIGITRTCNVPFKGKEYTQKNFACLCVPQ